MLDLTTPPVADIFSLIKSNLDTNSEELVQVNETNVGKVLLKDKMLAMICKSLNITPTFSEFTSAKGSKFIVLSGATAQEMKKVLLAM